MEIWQSLTTVSGVAGAALGALLSTVIALIITGMRGWRDARRIARADGAEKVYNDGYKQIVAEFRVEVDRLVAKYDKLEARLHLEETKRYGAETEAALLRVKVSELEERVRTEEGARRTADAEVARLKGQLDQMNVSMTVKPVRMEGGRREGDLPSQA